MAVISDSPHVIGVDDVHPAELVNEIAGAHNSIVNHFLAEHVGRGRDAGLHQLAVVPSAVARWDPPASRTLGSLVDGAGSIAFAIGFAEAPRLVAGTDPFFQRPGYFLRWKLAKPAGRAFVAVTAGWNTTSDAPIFLCKGDDEGNGAVRLVGMNWNTDSPKVPDEMTYLEHFTIAVHELR